MILFVVRRKCFQIDGIAIDTLAIPFTFVHNKGLCKVNYRYAKNCLSKIIVYKTIYLLKLLLLDKYYIYCLLLINPCKIK